ncbi:tubulin beta 3 class III [Homo sapiens]|uniref:Tubulin beta 3 class III n=1 Tax=Homo sapiens TaxID=9606 RepID=G3V4U2_HUMAN|nr:tubulin beta 3 class III [Homo sapiens]KAI2580307.1 tubulin beta 3 class III [Homo sapiens]KAI4056677.1 tubulin beta 3 class III [Homo sapiens]KAI4056681.1 tubulin beta 3 class III [Homo sapiens]
MREIVHIQAGQCGNQIGAKLSWEQSPRSTAGTCSRGREVEVAGRERTTPGS